jgi:glycosyltransferase involved in cell wall biosynthesis
MSNKPKMQGVRKLANPNKIEKIKTPARIRMFHHVADMAGCGTIRVIQPAMILNNYYSKKYQFESMFNNRYMPYPNSYDQCSVVTFQRSATKEQFDMIRHFKQNNPRKAVIYEIDDNLFDIPDWNFASGFYKEHKIHIENIMRFVDGIIVSTPHLKQLCSKFNRNVNISPNHLPKFIWGEARVKPIEELINYRMPRIMYAGSHNHFDTKGSEKGDFSPKLIDFVSKTLNKYQWIFVGGIPASLKGNKAIIHHEWRPVIEYPSFLKHMNPDICLAPLETNDFNRSKSNIKALESVAMGIPIVCSDINPYHGLPYTSSDDYEFISMIIELADNPEHRQQVWKQQYDLLKDQLFWEDNNHANLFDYVNQHLRLMGKEL